MENINFALFFSHLVVYLLVWVFAITAHAAFTAWLSNYFGDDTAKNQGRISFSPFVQADATGTIILPTLGFLVGWLGAGIPFIGWGKRVPINPENWRNPKLAAVVVTLASTFASLTIAVISFAVLKIMLASGLSDSQSLLQTIFGRTSTEHISWVAPFEIILWYSLAINLFLTLFSLIPIPPFAGGVALFSLLPESFKPVKDFFNNFGLFIALGLIYFFGIGAIFLPLINSVLRILVNQ